MRPCVSQVTHATEHTVKTAIVPRYGTPEIIHFAEVPTPRLRPNHVLLDVFASAVSQGDRRMRAGDFPGITALIGRLAMGFGGPRKSRPGSTFAGRVRAVGAEVTRFKVGDDVFGECMSGGHAEELAVAETSAIALLPVGVTHAEAAALPYGVCTANVFLHDLGRLKPGERAVIIGAAGGVGRYAVQVAASLGARVTAVCSESDRQRMLALGADEVIVRGTPVVGPVDLVFDTSGTSQLSVWREQLPSSGRFLTVDLTARLLLDLFRGLFSKGPKARFTIALCDQKQVQRIAEQIEGEVFKPVLGPTFAFDELVAAHRCLETDRPTGDVVVVMRDSDPQPGASTARSSRHAA